MRIAIWAALGVFAVSGASAAPAPNNSTKANQAESADGIQNALETIATAQTRSVEPVNGGEYQRPCRDGEYNSQSDLCAQWYAARAARDAANWSFWSLLLATVGTVGLLFSLHYTRKAVLAAEVATQDADEALRIAQENADAAKAQVVVAQETAGRQLRAYMVVDDFYWNGDWETGYQFGAVWRNAGKSPTRRLQTYIAHILCGDPLPDDFDFPIELGKVGSGHAGPNAKSFQGAAAPDRKEGVLSHHTMLEVQAGKKFAYIYGWARYYDIFDAQTEHVTKFCVIPQISLNADKSEFIFRFAMHSRHNCADEGCGD